MAHAPRALALNQAQASRVDMLTRVRPVTATQMPKTWSAEPLSEQQQPRGLRSVTCIPT